MMDDAEARKLNLRMAALCGYPVVPPDVSPGSYPCVVTFDTLVKMRYAGYGGEGWSPVTNPLQALEVAEALRAKGLYVRLTLIPDSENRDAHYIAKIEKKDGPSRLPLWDVYRLGNTLAEAICRAAAETLESEAGT